MATLSMFHRWKLALAFLLFSLVSVFIPSAYCPLTASAQNNSICGQLRKDVSGYQQFFIPCSGNPPLMVLVYSQPTTPAGLVDKAYYRVTNPQISQGVETCDPNLGCTTIEIVITVNNNPYANWTQISSCAACSETVPPTPTPGVSINPTSGSVGTTVTATGNKWTPGGQVVDVLWDNNYLTETSADNAGNFSISFTIPQDAATGDHEITFRDGNTGFESSTHFTVTATSNPPPPPPPPQQTTSSISGRVTDVSGICVAGVRLDVTDSEGKKVQSGHTVTNDQHATEAEYKIDKLPPGVYVVTPSKDGCTFTPPQADPATVPPKVEHQHFVGTPIVVPVKLAITNFTLTEAALTDFPPVSQAEKTYILKQNQLWIQITNTGQTPFTPPANGGQYILQVVLKQPGGKLEEYDYIPGYPPSLESLHETIAPGHTWNLHISNLFFEHQVQNGELEVFFKPSLSLNLPNSILAKDIIIENHPDSYCACIAETISRIASIMGHAAEAAAAANSGGASEIAVLSLKAKVGFDLAEHIPNLIKAGCKGSWKEFYKEISKWSLDEAANVLNIKGIGELYSLALDIGNTDTPCLKLSDRINSWIQELGQRGIPSNAIVTLSPVYPLAINAAGQRSGFLENGQAVQEMPDSRTAVIGEKRVILYPGRDGAEVHVVGYAAGTMSLYTFSTQTDGSVLTLSYENVQVVQGMRATLITNDSSHILKIDNNGDGTVDLNLPSGVTAPPNSSSPVGNPALSDGSFGDDAFRVVWERTDRPVKGGAPGLQSRTWIWGPQPLTSGAREPYAEGQGGTRLVQYFDKSRMEINHPDAPHNQWYVTNGLLVMELIEGRAQVGDTAFQDLTPADEAVAGDPADGNPNAPTYRSFRNVAYPVNPQRAAKQTGDVVIDVLAKDGSTSQDHTLARYNVTFDAYEDQLGHNIPKVFTTFFRQQGIVFEGGRYTRKTIIDWLFVVGLPISEPYWAHVKVGGVEKDVLMQAFQRRVLTYTPDNAPQWRVEMGNVGQHYLHWRYKH